MPRPQRIEYAHAWYHVMNRGRGRQTIFHDERYYQAFLHTLSEAHQRFSLQIHAYCLMGNHYHLLLNTPLGNLSRCMRHINGLYTQRYNRLKRSDGPLFRGRFKAILVEEDPYLLSLGRYIHRNPIDTKKPLVKELVLHPWSSYPAYINRVPSPDWLKREDSYAILGQKQRYKSYQRYVEQGNDAELMEFYAKDSPLPVLGTDSFKAFVSRKEWKNTTKTALVQQLYARPTIEDVIKAVAMHYHIDPTFVLRSKRSQANEPKWVAMYLCQLHTGETLKNIARAFNLGHESGVSQQIRSLKNKVKQDAKLERRLKLLIHDLTPMA